MWREYTWKRARWLHDLVEDTVFLSSNGLIHKNVTLLASRALILHGFSQIPATKTPNMENQNAIVSRLLVKLLKDVAVSF
jgi:hypothetical protein